MKKIVALKRLINRGSISPELAKAFPNTTQIDRPIVQNKKISNPFWLAGFTAAEGCIFIHIRISNTCCTGFQVILYFQVTQHSRDEQLMRSFIEYLDCGNIKKSRETFNFIVTKLDDITQKIIPFFIKYPILGVKSKYFQYWFKVAYMMK